MLYPGAFETRSGVILPILNAVNELATTPISLVSRWCKKSSEGLCAKAKQKVLNNKALIRLLWSDVFYLGD